MGRIKPTFIKRAGADLFKNYEDRLKKDFDHNKGVVQELINSGVFASPSKRMRNKVAGYLTREMHKDRNITYKPLPKKRLPRRGPRMPRFRI